MEKIYLKCLALNPNSGVVKVAVFLKQVSQKHTENLIGFLRNQKIKCYDFPGYTRDKISELSYFDHCFEISFAVKRWSFFSMRSYIRNYLGSWNEEVAFCSDYLKSYDARDETLVFDDKFYVDLTKRIDRCENIYYQEDRSISLFLNGVMRILYENLQLYWVVTKTADIRTGERTYLNHYPAAIPLQKVASLSPDNISEPVRIFPVEFCNEHIVDFYIHPGPFSPQKETVDKFVKYVLMQIDDFIYGDIISRRQKFELESEIAQLKKQYNHVPRHVERPPIAPKDIADARLIVIAGSQIPDKMIISELCKKGFAKNKIVLKTEYSKHKSIDINNLKKIRSQYDGILLGPMPHKMAGKMDGDSLISMMQNNAEDYPPFAVIRDKSGELKVSKQSFRAALDSLVPKLERYNNYQAVF
jgi:hypothetical protein